MFKSPGMTSVAGVWETRVKVHSDWQAGAMQAVCLDSF